MNMNRVDFDPRWYGAAIRSDNWHFHRRLFERCGLVLAPGEYSAIRRAIASGRAKRIRRRERASLYWVEIASARAFVAVMARGGRLLTVLPTSKAILRWKEAAELPGTPEAVHRPTAEEAGSA